MVDGSADDNHSKPKPCHCKVRPGHYRTGNHWTKVDDKVLEGVAVDGSHTHWSRPLVMCFVDVLVKLRVVKESVSEDSHVRPQFFLCCLIIMLMALPVFI